MQKLAYEKLMEEKSLTVSELPKDAQIGIESCRKIVHAIKMAEKRQQKIQPVTIQKLQANDKWVVREILDYIDDKESNQGDLPNDTEEVIDEITGDQMTPEERQMYEQGVAVEAELENLIKSGKRQFTLPEIKSAAPKAYAIIFDGYTEGEENGVATSKYSLIEDPENKEVFNLK